MADPRQLVAQLLKTGAVNERTVLSPSDEAAFRQWAMVNKIPDVDHPDSYYDYRGHWRRSRGEPIKFGVDHFPDTFKQRGHPTFSTESQYSKGPSDGGNWIDEVFIPQLMKAHK